MGAESADAQKLIDGLAPLGAPVTWREPLRDDEARWFAAGLNNNVFEFSECRDDCFRYKKWSKRGPDHFETPSGSPRHLYSKPAETEAWLNREYVPHLAAYARAVLDFGYDKAASSFSLYRKFSRDLISKKRGGTFETDAEFYDADGNIHLQIEAKAQPNQIATLVNHLERASDLAELPPGLSKEIEYILDLRPKYLWVVGPGSVEPAPHVYGVEVDGLNARLTELDTFPAPP